MAKILKNKGRNRNGQFSTECAEDTNRWLLEKGVESYGNAYQIPSQFKSVINGYDHVDLPTGKMKGFSSADSTKVIMNAHRAASDYIKDNFDINTLDKDQNYVVNMYYNNSPHMNTFYKNAEKGNTDHYGTHVGRLYNDENGEWVVEHNIHGDIHIDPLIEVLGGLRNKHRYGVTSISTTNPTWKTALRNFINKFR